MNQLQRYEYFDAHTHLESNSYSKTFAIRSFRAGIETPDTECYTIGVHPYDVENQSELKFDEYEGKILAIGEIGLDFRFAQTIKLQIRIFEEQLKTANSRSLPVVIHCVKAYPQTLHLLKKHGCKSFMFHGFDSSLKNSQNIINDGGYISFGNKLLINRLLQKVFTTTIATNPSCVLLESDEKAGIIPELYNVGAQLSGLDQTTFNDIIKQNFKTFYNL